MLLLIAHKALRGPKRSDHPLKDDRSAYGECGIDRDFLLISDLEGDTVLFIRGGADVDLFSGMKRPGLSAPEDRP